MKLPLRDYGNEPHQLKPARHTGLDWLWAHCKLGHVGWTMLLGVVALLVAFGYVTDTQAQSNNGTFLSRLTLGNPTGPTPAAGQENAQNPYLINGTPVVPNCTDNKIIVEDNTSGFNAAIKCNSAFLTTATPSNNSTLKVNAGNLVEFNTATPTFTPIPTVTPIPPVATATREAQGFAISTATPVLNCLLEAVSSAQVNCVANGTAVTPAPTVTPVPVVSTATPQPAGATATPELYLQATTATPAPNTFLNYAGTPGPAKWVTIAPTATIVPTATPSSGCAGYPCGSPTAPLTNSLGGTVALNNTATYFDGPSVANDTTAGHVWCATGTVVINATAGDQLKLKLWDGTTTFASSSQTAANPYMSISVSGCITSPGGNIRISVNDASATSATIQFNASGLSKDSTITAWRQG